MNSESGSDDHLKQTIDAFNQSLGELATRFVEFAEDDLKVGLDSSLPALRKLGSVYMIRSSNEGSHAEVLSQFLQY